MIDLSLFPPQQHPYASVRMRSFALEPRTSRSSVAGEIVIKLGYDSTLPYTSDDLGQLSSSSQGDASRSREGASSASASQLSDTWTRQYDRNGRLLLVNAQLRAVCYSEQEALAIQSGHTTRGESQPRTPEPSREDTTEAESSSSSTSLSSAAAASPSQSQGPLPEGWTRNKTKDGR